MELHLQVKEARQKAGMTQSDLAAKAQVGRKDISRFENGENVTMKTFLKIVNALPNLTELSLGAVALRKAGAEDAEALRKRATDVLERIREGRQEAPADAEPPQSREVSLLRTLGQLLVEITGGDRK